MFRILVITFWLCGAFEVWADDLEDKIMTIENGEKTVNIVEHIWHSFEKMAKINCFNIKANESDVEFKRKQNMKEKQHEIELENKKQISKHKLKRKAILFQAMLSVDQQYVQ